MWLQQVQEQTPQLLQPINTTIILVTILNGIFALLGGIFHARMPGQIATAITTSLRPPPLSPSERLEDTIRTGRPRV